MPTISWVIERLLCKSVGDTLTDVVITADWRCNGLKDGFTGTCYGTCSFAPPTGSFSPYPYLTEHQVLTEQQVLDWCFANGVDKTAIEANVTQQINDQINPPVVVLPLPWAPPAPVVVADDAPVADAPAA